jgi:hypothetical protein
MGERPVLDLGDNRSLSHSRRSTFRRCRRLYFLQYVQGLQLKETPAPLRMGSIYSDGLETQDPEVVQREYSELVAEAMHDGNYYFAEQLLDELAVVRPMVETYLSTVSLPDIEREVSFVGPAFQGYQDNGFFDGIGNKYVPGDRLLLVENKLKGRFGKAEEEALQTDEQLLGYILNACIKYDVKADQVEVRYEVAKKPGLRQGKTETRETFRARVSADIRNNPEKYHVVIGGERLGRTQSQLDQWMHEFQRMVHDLHQEDHYSSSPELDSMAWPMNRDACHQYGVCPMIRICGASSQEQVALEIEKNFNIKGDA